MSSIASGLPRSLMRSPLREPWRGISRHWFRVRPRAHWSSPPVVPSRRVSLIVLGLAVAAAAADLAIVLDADLEWAWSDGWSRLTIARSIFDNQQPGLAQFGNTWLPLHMAAMLPTVWIDWMFRSGAAGILVSLIALVATTFYAHRFIFVLTGSQAGAAIGALALLGSLNFTYMAATPMSEVPFTALYTAGWYYLLCWAKGRTLGNLVKAALFVAASAMVRYDGWFSLFVGVLFIAIISVNRADRRWSIRAEAEIIAFGAIVSFPVFLWAYYNWQIFGHPLSFAFGESSTGFYVELAAAAGYSLKQDLARSMEVFGWTVFDNLGAVALITAVAGTAIGTIWLRRPGAVLALLLPASAIVFNVATLYLGGSVVQNQHVTPEFDLYNARYGVLVAPWAAIAVGVLASSGLIPALVAALAVAAQLVIFTFSGPLITVSDATATGFDLSRETAARFNEVYDEGLVLIAYRDHSPMVPHTNVNLATFIHEGVNLREPSSRDAMRNPARYVRFIVVREGGLGNLEREITPGVLTRDFDILESTRNPKTAGVDQIYRVKPEAAERERALMEAEKAAGADGG